MKKMSHYERMNTVGEYVPKPQIIRERARMSVTSKLDEKTRRIVKSCEFKKVDDATNLNQYHVNDFALENLIAVGVELHPTKLASSRFGMLDEMERITANVESSNIE